MVILKKSNTVGKNLIFILLAIVSFSCSINDPEPSSPGDQPGEDGVTDTYIADSVIWEANFLTSQPWSDPTVPNGGTPFGTHDSANYVQEVAGELGGMRLFSSGSNPNVQFSTSSIEIGVDYVCYMYVPAVTAGLIILSQGGTNISFNILYPGEYTFEFTSTSNLLSIKCGTNADVTIQWVKIVQKNPRVHTGLHDDNVPDGFNTEFGQNWHLLPRRTYTYKSIINSNWHANAPYPWLSITENGLEGVFDPYLNVASYHDWIEHRAEIREEPQRAPALNSTSVYCMDFMIIDMPDPIGSAAVTIFQRFRNDLDFADLDVELTAAGQFNGINANTLAVGTWNGADTDWATSNDNTYVLGGKNQLVVAIENKKGGEFKVSFNGNTIASGTGDFTPDTSSTPYTGPQLPVYNHGENDDYMKIIHTKYTKFEYTSKPNFADIKSFEQN